MVGMYTPKHANYSNLFEHLKRRDYPLNYGWSLALYVSWGVIIYLVVYVVGSQGFDLHTYYLWCPSWGFIAWSPTPPSLCIMINPIEHHFYLIIIRWTKRIRKGWDWLIDMGMAFNERVHDPSVAGAVHLLMMACVVACALHLEKKSCYNIRRYEVAVAGLTNMTSKPEIPNTSIYPLRHGCYKCT